MGSGCPGPGLGPTDWGTKPSLACLPGLSTLVCPCQCQHPTVKLSASWMRCWEHERQRSGFCLRPCKVYMRVHRTHTITATEHGVGRDETLALRGLPGGERGKAWATARRPLQTGLRCLAASTSWHNQHRRGSGSWRVSGEPGARAGPASAPHWDSGRAKWFRQEVKDGLRRRGQTQEALKAAQMGLADGLGVTSPA